MPATVTYPGVYIQEIPSGVCTITGVETSITAFIGRALRGPTDEDDESPTVIHNFGDFERIYGGLCEESRLGFAVRDFFLNGGAQAIIVRLFKKKATAEPFAKFNIAGVRLRSAYPGKWGSNLRVSLDVETSDEAAGAMGLVHANGKPDKTKLFNISVRDTSTGATERFSNVSVVDSPRRVDRILKSFSKLLRWDESLFFTPTPPITAVHMAHRKRKGVERDPTDRAKKTAYANSLAALKDALSTREDDVAALSAKSIATPVQIQAAKDALIDAIKTFSDAISDGDHLDRAAFLPRQGKARKKGLFALEKADLFNILCIPPYKSSANGFDVESDLIGKVAAYCEKRRAFYIVDPPSSWVDKDDARQGLDALGTKSKNAAIFFPRLRMPNPINENRLEDFAPSGAVAGIFARTDTNRGVWKAPAGADATFVAVPAFAVELTNADNAELNSLGINCLRTIAPAGRVVWGARTLQGADGLGSEWKYIPIRRTALFIEESLYRGTQWVVFEPNDEPLWAQIRRNVGAFMHVLFREGVFQGTTPKDAYFVKCDKESNPQNDVDRGLVNIIVGFAPLKPGEFVVIKLQQIAGQLQT